MLNFDEDFFMNLFTEDVFFIQIGANDGISCDPIHNLVLKNKWKGILFEPGKDAFETLQKNYKNVDDLILVNEAVSDYDGVGTLYCGTTTPHFTLSKLKAEHMFSVTPFEVEVKITSPSTIIEKYNVNKLDLLQIDTEGLDFVILKAFPFNLIKPKVIRCEYVNFSYSNVELNEVVEYLKQFNYTTYINSASGDILSILN